MKKEITIVGAGLVGSLLAIYLCKRGYGVKIFERRPDMRSSSIEKGRSINLALSDRGLLALHQVGVSDEIKEISIPMNGRFIHNLDGSTAIQPYGKQGQFINSVSRSQLNRKLIDIAEQHGALITFNARCSSVNWEKMEIGFEQPGQSNLLIHKAALLFGADGAFSASRLQHQLQHDKLEYSQHYIDCGYKELMIPAGPENSFRMEKNALHIWPRKDYMLIALPNLRGSFTCTLFFPFEGKESFDELNTESKVTSFFNETFPDIVTLIPNLSEQFFENPVSSLVTIKCYPWVRGDQFALIGDAAHAIVPFFGQGMNCGFEDCRVLDELIGKYGDEWKVILQEFQVLRKPDADAIADMAVENFIEMRARTADPLFLLQKKIEARLNEKYPEKWIPAYSQVTFSPHIRYSEALQRGRLQESIMKEIMQIPRIERNWQSKEIEDLILQKMERGS